MTDERAARIAHIRAMHQIPATPTHEERGLLLDELTLTTMSRDSWQQLAHLTRERAEKAEAERDQLAGAVHTARAVAEVIEANGLSWAADSIRRALDGTLGAAPTRVTDHTFEGAPGPGSRCETDLFGQTCGTVWEQHELREQQAS